MKDKQFMPLNISYAQKKVSDRRLIFTGLSLVIMVICIILVVKIHYDYPFSGILGSGLFLYGGVGASMYFGIFLIRKLAFQERELMRLYKEMLAHEMTTINDLWEILAVEDDMARYYDDTTKIFLRCEKGYVIGREPKHEEMHRAKVRDFINHITTRGYFIDYYNWHNQDANTKPLDELEKKIRVNPNARLRAIGADLLKSCRELEYACEDSEIEYWVISADTARDAAYLRSTVESAAKILIGSLYTDVTICNLEGIVEAIEIIYKIKGINVNSLLSGQFETTTQRVVRVLRAIRDDVTETPDTSEDENYNKFLEMLEEADNRRKEEAKQQKPTNLASMSDVGRGARPHSYRVPVEDKVGDGLGDEALVPIAITDEFTSEEPVEPQPIPQQIAPVQSMDSSLDDDDDEDLSSLGTQPVMPAPKAPVLPQLEKPEKSKQSEKPDKPLEEMSMEEFFAEFDDKEL